MTAQSSQETPEGERLAKLMLFIEKNAPVSFACIRQNLDSEYGEHIGDDPAEKKKHDDKIRRRFERDKDTLREYGVFIVADLDNNYSIDREKSYTTPVDLSVPQVSMLRLLCNALLQDESYPFKSEVRMILIKLGQELEVPDLLPSMNSDEQKGDRSITGLAKIRKAIQDRKRLSFEYSNANGASSTRAVEPIGCFMFNRNCYLVAFDPSANEERCFRLDRMRRIKPNAKSPSIPDFNARPFNMSEFCGLPFQFGDQERTARLRFDANNAWRAMRLCMGQGSIETDNDEAIWSVSCSDSDMLVQWCIENGPGIEILEPESARRRHDELVQAALEALQ